MSEGRPAHACMLDASQAEHERLVAQAQLLAEPVREMCTRAGLGQGTRLIDVGCGPIGALVELAEMAGPRGSVVGIDSSPEAVEMARTIVASKGLSNVRVVLGDIHAIQPADVMPDGGFDAAHLRLVLFHQADPVATLRRSARLVRPEGYVLVTDFVNDPHYASFDPPLPTYAAAWDVLFAAARHRGATVDVGRRLPQLCEEAGLRVVDARGSFSLVTPARAWIALTRTLLGSARRAIVSQAVASDGEVDGLMEALAKAEGQEFRSALGHLYVHAIAQVPSSSI